MANPGSIAAGVPYGEDAQIRRRADLEREVRENNAARRLARSQMGDGGTLRIDGSLEVTGDISVPGTLSSAGNLSAGNDVTAVRDVTGGRDVISGRNITAAGVVTGASVSIAGTGKGFDASGTANAVDVNAAGNVVAAGNVGAGGTVVGMVVKTTSGPTTNITTGRVTSWLQNSDGLVGTATSSERFKANIRAVRDDPDFDPLAVLRLSIDFWEYRAEIAKRDEPDSADYVGPDYHVGLNFGPIAERAHELGLWMIVVYEREDDGVTLRLDDDGGPIPYGLHDVLFGYLVAIAAQVMLERQHAQEQRIDALALRIAALDGQSELSSR